MSVGIAIAEDETIPLAGSAVDDVGQALVNQMIVVRYLPLQGITIRGSAEEFFNTTTTTSVDGSFNLARRRLPTIVATKNRQRMIGGITQIDADEKTANVRAVQLMNVRGRLLDPQGQPVTKQTLVAGWKIGASLIFPVEAKTDDNGKFEIAGMLPGWECALRRLNDNRSITPLTTFTPKTDDVDVGDVRLPGPRNPADQTKLALSGNVIDANGKPVKGLTVEAAFLQMPITGARQRAKAVTSDDGKFQIQRPEVPAVVWVRTKDATQGCLLQIDEQQTEAVLQLQPLASVHGTVLSARGSPLGIATILCSYTVPVRDGYSVAISATGQIEPDGTYVVRGLFVDKSHTIQLFDGKMVLPTTKTVTPSKAESIDLGETRLPRGAKE